MFETTKLVNFYNIRQNLSKIALDNCHYRVNNHAYGH